MKIVKISIIAAAFTLFFIACAENKPANTQVKSNNNAVLTNSAPTSPAAATPAAPTSELASAAKLYKENCATCHKDNGEGGKVTVEGKTMDPASLTSDKMKKRSDEKLASEISEGVIDEGMPAFKGKLTDAQIKDIVLFIRKDLQKL